MLPCPSCLRGTSNVDAGALEVIDVSRTKLTTKEMEVGSLVAETVRGVVLDTSTVRVPLVNGECPIVVLRWANYFC